MSLLQLASIKDFILCDNWKILFFIQIYCYLEFAETVVLLCSLKQVFWKKFAFYIRYLHNNITMLLMLKAHNKVSTS